MQLTDRVDWKYYACLDAQISTQKLGQTLYHCINHTHCMNSPTDELFKNLSVDFRIGLCAVTISLDRFLIDQGLKLGHQVGAQLNI